MARKLGKAAKTNRIYGLKPDFLFGIFSPIFLKFWRSCVFLMFQDFRYSHIRNGPKIRKNRAFSNFPAPILHAIKAKIAQ